MAGDDEHKRRIGRLQRIEKLRRQLHEASSWKLAALTQEREKLAAAHAQMIEALGEGLMAYGPASAAGARRVRRIELELQIAGKLEKDLEAHTLAQGRMAKLAEGSLDVARAKYRDGRERRSLEELIDATVAVAPVSRKP
jgi:hypothetical protein